MLARDGFAYARTGAVRWPRRSLHLAWQISGDHRYQAAFGTIDDLIAEIADQPRHIIPSSEDFVCSVHHPESFSRFVDRLHGSGFAPRIVVCVRNQVDYAESLYLELLKFGLTDPFDRFVSEIVAERSYRWRDWISSSATTTCSPACNTSQVLKSSSARTTSRRNVTGRRLAPDARAHTRRLSNR